MAFEGNTGLQVASQYGARDTGTSVGVQTTKTGYNVLSIELTGKGLAEKFIPPLVIPKRASVQRATLTVDQAFVGVTNVIVGKSGTDGFTLAAADLTAVGVKAVTGAGQMAKDAQVTQGYFLKVTPTGTVNPTVGKATLTVEYLYNTRDDAAWKDVDQTTKPVYKAQG